MRSYASRSPYVTRPPRARFSPLGAPLLLFAAVTLISAAYVAYVLWPRWPDVPVALDAPSLPITVAGVTFNIEPTAIRMAVQRRPGRQERIDLAYQWPSLTPPEREDTTTASTADNPEARLFVTIATGVATLPPMERVKTIYPRYLAPQSSSGPDGLTLRAFRDDTPYRDEELAYDPAKPEHFMARCSLHGVVNSGSCLLERRVGNADITVRFPRDWLGDWRSVADGVDHLLAKLRPS